jgi:SAM-dependent methyltransferase
MEPGLFSNHPPNKKLEKFCKNGEGKRALDLACGTGRHALWLAAHGWKVTAVDFAPTALEKARELAAAKRVSGRLRFIEADLKYWSPPPAERYDLIVMINYLDRDLIGRLNPFLSAGGLWIIDTFSAKPGNGNQDGRRHLLHPGELPHLMEKEFGILGYESYEIPSGGGETAAKEGIVARKTGKI